MKKYICVAIAEAILGFPKTLSVNFKCLPLKQAIKLPIIVSNHTYLRSLKGRITIDAPIKTGMILWGIGDVGIFDQKRSRSIIELGVDGKIVFNGKARFGNGVKVSVDGKLIIGNNFTVTAESTILCHKKITFGKDCLISWEDLIIDTDFHKVLILDKQTNKDEEIHIGDHVWIGCRSTILKGSNIADGTVIAACSLVNGKNIEKNSIIGGVPMRTLASKVTWER